MVSKNILNNLLVNKQTNKLEINFLTYKRKREEKNLQLNTIDSTGLSSLESAIILDDSEYHNINLINSTNELAVIIFKEKIKILNSLFYERDPFCSFFSLEEYQSLINSTFYFNNIQNFPPHLKQPLKNLNETLFDKEINKNLISLNKMEKVFAELIRLYSNSLYINIFKQLENVYNHKKWINKIILIGDRGIGKSHAMWLYSIFLRMNPYNLVFTIFNVEEFFNNPLTYLTNEVVYSLYFLYNNNSQLDLKDLEKFFSVYHLMTCEENNSNILVTFKQAFEIFRKMIENVIKAYDSKINIYFIIDNYERTFSTFTHSSFLHSGILSNLSHSEKIELIEMIENLKFDNFLNYKIILSTNTDNNELIIQKFKELKLSNDLEALDHRIIFLNSSQIFKDEDFYIFIEKKFGYTNRKIIKNLIKYSGYNYEQIESYFNSIPANKYEEFNYHRDSDVKFYFVDNMAVELHRLIDSPQISLEKKVYVIYNLFSYKSNENEDKPNSNHHNIHQKYDFYANEIFKHYIFKYVHPEYKNGSITFKIANELVKEFLFSFNYEDYFKNLKLKFVDMKFYADWYSSTNDQFLRGIFVEELAFLFFKNSKVYLNQEFRYFFQRIENFGFYSKGNIIRPEEEIDMPYYSKINNPNNLFIQENRLGIKIEKIKKFYSADDQIFGGDKILKFQNGLYFLNPKFPIIDAIIVNQERKNLILIQIKKTMNQKQLDAYFDDFHTLYFLLENPEYYRIISESFMNESRLERQTTITTKLQLFMKLAHFVKTGWSLNFMFTYRHIDNTFEFIHDNMILDKYYITFENCVTASSFVIENENFRRNENVLGNFKIENKTVTLFRRRILHNTIMVDLNDFTNGLIEDKKFSNFIK